jgi:hypothetical protein
MSASPPQYSPQEGGSLNKFRKYQVIVEAEGAGE